MKKYVITASTKTYKSLKEAEKEINKLYEKGILWDYTVVYETTKVFKPSLKLKEEK